MLEQLDPPFLDLHAATWTAPEQYEVLPNARRFENWENYVAGKVGLGVAVDYALEIGLDAIAERVQGLANGLRQRMAALPGITVQDLGAEKSGIISFSVADTPAEQVATACAAAGINISVSSARSTQQDMHHRGIAIMNRMGVHYYNTEDELDRFMDCLESILAAI
jgi:selenocysteine lyase/cysteine desulfurase